MTKRAVLCGACNGNGVIQDSNSLSESQYTTCGTCNGGGAICSESVVVKTPKKFRRNIHTVEGEYRECFRTEKLTQFQKLVWDAHGDIVHVLSSKELLTFDEILDNIRKDTTNFDYHPADLKQWRDGSPLPDPKDVALALLRCIEAGYVEVV